MQQQLQDERANQQLALLEKANEIENRDREILLLKQNIFRKLKSVTFRDIIRACVSFSINSVI